MSTRRDQRRPSNTDLAAGWAATVPAMTTTTILSLLLALSTALNLGLVATSLARATGKSPAAAALVGGGAALTALTVFFTAITAYH